MRPKPVSLHYLVIGLLGFIALFDYAFAIDPKFEEWQERLSSAEQAYAQLRQDVEQLKPENAAEAAELLTLSISGVHYEMSLFETRRKDPPRLVPTAESFDAICINWHLRSQFEIASSIDRNETDRTDALDGMVSLSEQFLASYPFIDPPTRSALFGCALYLVRTHEYIPEKLVQMCGSRITTLKGTARIPLLLYLKSEGVDTGQELERFEDQGLLHKLQVIIDVERK